MVKITNIEVDQGGLSELQQVWWNDIKSREIEIYGLAEKFISDFASPINLDPTALYLIVKAPAAVTAIEAAVSHLTEMVAVDTKTMIRVPKYSISMSNKYLVVMPSEGKIMKGPNGKPTFVPAVK